MVDLASFVYWRVRRADDKFRITSRARASNRGERLVVTGRMEDDLDNMGFDHQAHYQRYMFAAERASASSPRVIVDYGCGTGYGAAFLARRFPQAQVVGFDVSKEAIEYARTRQREPNLRYTDDVAELPPQADLVVSFDVIEHVPDPRAFALRLADLAAPGAVCLVSAPNGLVSRGDNPHHLHEPTPTDLAAWLSGFPHVEVLGQDVVRGGERFGRAWEDAGDVAPGEMTVVRERVEEAFGLLAVATRG